MMCGRDDIDWCDEPHCVYGCIVVVDQCQEHSDEFPIFRPDK